MKILLKSLIAVAVMLSIAASCWGPAVVYTGELQSQDTIKIVTQPGFSYQIRVLPVSPKINPIIKPLISTNYGFLDIGLPDDNGGGFNFLPCMDTIHIVGIIQPDGSTQKYSCYEMNGSFQVICGDEIKYAPCNQDNTYDCDDLP